MKTISTVYNVSAVWLRVRWDDGIDNMPKVFIETIKDSAPTEKATDDMLFHAIEIDPSSVIDIDGLGEKSTRWIQGDTLIVFPEPIHISIVDTEEFEEFNCEEDGEEELAPIIMVTKLENVQPPALHVNNN